MKFFILFSFVFLSFHTSVSAMMRCPYADHDKKEAHVRAHKQMGREYNPERDQRQTGVDAYVKVTQPQKINSIVCETALEVYGKINQHWSYPGLNNIVEINSPYWKVEWLPGSSIINGEKVIMNCPTLILQKPEAVFKEPQGIIKAFEDLVSSKAVLECAVALNAVKILSLKKLLGDVYFEKYAIHFYDQLKTNPKWSTNHFYDMLPLQFITEVEGKEHPGSIVYITNLSWYHMFKPNGNCTGSNLVCVGDNKYIGFSRIYQNGPQPLETIEQQDYAEFLKSEDVEELHEQHKIYKTIPLEKFQTARRQEQEKHYNFHFIFDCEKLQEYIVKEQINFS